MTNKQKIINVLKNIILFGGVSAWLNSFLLIIKGNENWYLWGLAFFAAFCVGFLLALCKYRKNNSGVKTIKWQKSHCWLLIILAFLFSLIGLSTWCKIYTLMFLNLLTGWNIYLSFVYYLINNESKKGYDIK